MGRVLIFKLFIGLPLLLHLISFSQASVTRIYTDHNGFFTSAVGSPVSVDVATHHLLAFQTGGTVWSTGVDDLLLTTNSVTFSAQSFQAMPASVNGSSSSAVIGIGRQYGGYIGSEGCDPSVVPPFGSNVSAYLTDGTNGLDISTAIFNIGGDIEYVVSAIADVSIGDGIPDILITQTGDLNSLVGDRFRFLDASDNIVGNEVQVNFSGVDIVARPYWKFYDLSDLSCGASTASTRDLRLLVFDFADLGITTSNYSDIVKFQHQMTPNSDIAFVAYNTTSIDIMPITLLYFTAEMKGREVHLSWKTASELDNDYFTVERSQDGIEWEKVIVHPGAGNSQEEISYEEVDFHPLPGVSYYRLKQTDFDGTTSVSDIVAVNFEDKATVVYPNPVEDVLFIRGKNLKSSEIFISNPVGQDVTTLVSVISTGNNLLQFDSKKLKSGYYFIHCSGEVYPFHKQ